MHSTYPEMGHGLRCRQTMFTKQLSHRVGNLDPQIVAPRGRAGRANSKKDLVTGPIRGFCAPQDPTDPTSLNLTVYGADAPITFTDPTGMKIELGEVGKAGPCSRACEAEIEEIINDSVQSPGVDHVEGAANPKPGVTALRAL